VGATTMTDAAPWYEHLRERYRPDRVRLLLVAESAPDPGGAERRFFYAPVLSAHDNLFRGVVRALYGTSPGRKADDKTPWLERLRDDGVFLIDLVPSPVDKLTSGARASARRQGVRPCIETITRLDPSGIVVCHAPTFRLLRGPLRDARLPLLHVDPIPFPLGNWREEFVAGVRDALGRSDDASLRSLCRSRWEPE